MDCNNTQWRICWWHYILYQCWPAVDSYDSYWVSTLDNCMQLAIMAGNYILVKMTEQLLFMTGKEVCLCTVMCCSVDKNFNSTLSLAYADLRVVE